MKKILFLILLLTAFSFADAPESKARGLFLSVGVGPRFPLGYFANSSDIGYAFNLEIAYTDNEYLPMFLFAKVGYEQYTGSHSFYQETEYSNYSTAALPVQLGARYYFEPLMENVVLFMPVVEASFSYVYYEKLHQFKPEAGRSNFLEENSKIGLSGGVGISMFLLEIMANYNYFQTNQYVSIDLKVRIPLYVAF